MPFRVLEAGKFKNCTNRIDTIPYTRVLERRIIDFCISPRVSLINDTRATNHNEMEEVQCRIFIMNDNVIKVLHQVLFQIYWRNAEEMNNVSNWYRLDITLIYRNIDYITLLPIPVAQSFQLIYVLSYSIFVPFYNIIDFTPDHVSYKMLSFFLAAAPNI